MRRFCWLALLTAIGCGSAGAAPAEGTFTATAACPALQSIRNGTNPGGVMTKPGTAYRITEVNNLGAPTHYRVDIPGASPPQRWVEIACGSDGSSDAGTVLEAGPGSYLLAASWQPGFCETQPDRRECRNQQQGRFDATHFALHGLWPQPRSKEYCGVSQRDIEADQTAWRLLPELPLSAATRAELDKVMPGTASLLDRHEWIVHGTCYEESAESYFSESLALMAQLNASGLRDFLNANLGRAVTPSEIRAAADEAFGRGAGERIGIACKTEQDGNRVVLTELQIALYGAIDETSDLAALIRAARPIGSNAGQCPRVVIDKAGL